MLRLRFLLLALALAGCGDPYKYDPDDRTDSRAKSLQVTHTVGGVHWCASAYAGGWYQGFGHRVLSLAPRTGAVLSSLEPIPAGHGGAVRALVAWHGDLYAVVERTALVRIDVRDPKDLVVVEASPSSALGIEPLTASVIDDRLFVSGIGGVVEFPSGERFLAGQEVTGEVLRVGQELAVIVGTTLTALDGASLQVPASAALPLPIGVGPEGGALVLEQALSSTAIALLDGSFSEVSRVALGKHIVSISVCGGRAWGFTPSSVFTWAIHPDRLDDEVEVKIRGAIGIELLGRNRYAIYGAFGRSLYRLEPDEEGPADEFHRSHREPGNIVIALSDQRRIIAGTPTEVWSYAVGGDCDLVQRSLQVGEMPRKDIKWEDGEASIQGDDATTLLVEIPGSKQEFTLPRIQTMAIVDTDLWVAHADGVAVYRRASGGGVEEIAALRLPGPITHVFARRAGQGASYVSALGGMGTTEWRAETPSPRDTTAGK